MSDNKNEEKNWREGKYKKTVDSFGERKDVFKTDSGIELDPLYTQNDVEDIDPAEDIGFPGQYPFTRGVYPTMYRSRL